MMVWCLVEMLLIAVEFLRDAIACLKLIWIWLALVQLLRLLVNSYCRCLNLIQCNKFDCLISNVSVNGHLNEYCTCVSTRFVVVDL